MIIHQQWTKDKKVAAFAVQRCTNGMSGWEARVCFYDPVKGETAQTMPWVFLAAAPDVLSIIKYPVLSMMAELIDQPEQIGSLTSLLESLQVTMTHIASQLEKT